MDPETWVLRVCQPLAQTDGGPALAFPKSSKSPRRKHHTVDQDAERLGPGGLWEDRSLVLHKPSGGFLSPYLLTGGPIKRRLERSGLPQIRCHDLRHTCATIMLSRCVHAKLVQELLGHASIAQTLDTYSHVLPGMGGGIAGAMEDAPS